MIFTKDDTSTSDEQVDNLTREINIQYRACIGSLLYLLSRRVDLSFAVHKLAKFLANPDKAHFEGLVHILRCIRDNNTFGLKYYADMNDAPVSDLWRQANIKTENQVMDFSDYIWQDCPDTIRSTGARQNTGAQYIATQPLLDLCERATHRGGGEGVQAVVGSERH